MSLGLAIFASVVLVLAVYHKQFRKVLLYTIAVGANKNVGDIFDQLAALNGKSLEDQCETDPTLNIIPTKTQAKASAPEIIPIYGGETSKIIKSEEEAGGRKVTPIAGAIPLLYLGHNQKFVVACGNYNEKNNPAPNPVIEGITITCK
jgi:hypothetical protein